MPDSLKSTAKSSTGKAKSMADLMASFGKNIKPLQKGDTVEGTVKKLTPQEILLDIGGKGDALVLEYDKKNMENLLKLLKLGDRVKAQVLSPEAEEGFPVVSLRRTLDDAIYSGLEKAYENNEIVKADIVDETKGGFFAVTNSGVRGFLPNSQTLDEDDLVGKRLDTKIVEFDRSKKRVIFSQKATVYTVNAEEINKHYKKGDTVKAEVNNVTPYGIYINLEPKGGALVEGFIHISEVSHDRVEDLESLFEKGNKIEAQVIDIDKENRRVNLSLKSLTKDSFEDIKEKYKVEQKVKGTVIDVKSRGVTLQLDEQIKGFIPAAKIPSSTSYTVGDAIEVEVSDFDMKRRLVIVSPILKAIPIGYR